MATEAAPGQVENEDQVFHHGAVVGVVDGVTAPAKFDSGCVHNPAWYARQLAARLVEVVDESPESSLAHLLAQAISEVRRDHGGACDLDNPNTPAATVNMVCTAEDRLEYLILCDSPLIVDTGDATTMIVDRRFEQIIAQIRQDTLIGDVPIGSPEHQARMLEVAARKQQLTNTPAGYWIAAADPGAAHQALTGSLPLTGPGAVRRAALLTDGASRAVDTFALYDWAGLLDLITEHGPQELIHQVRLAETADVDGYIRPRYKRHDDATVALCLFTQEDQ